MSINTTLTIQCVANGCNKLFHNPDFQLLMKSLMDHYQSRHKHDLAQFQARVASIMEDVSYLCLMDMFDVPDGSSSESYIRAMATVKELADGATERLEEFICGDADDASDDDDEDDGNSDNEEYDLDVIPSDEKIIDIPKVTP